MSQKNETGVLILSLLITAGIVGSGYWWFTHSNSNQNTSSTPSPIPYPATPTPVGQLPPPTSPGVVTALTPPTNVPRGTKVSINGSTSMVQINLALKNSFEQQFPGTTVKIAAEGSDKGLEALSQGKVDIAAVSRPLTAQEQSQGLVAIPIAKDAIAIIVGEQNPFRTGLTQEQIRGIFTGKINNWSAVGGLSVTIRVINRPSISGTYKTFVELVLKGDSFGNGANFTSMERDATTPILQALGKEGISYATYNQVAKQHTVRTVSIDGLTPEAANYPYQRTLYYVYKEPPNPAVKAFLGYGTSPKGQEAIAASLIVP